MSDNDTIKKSPIDMVRFGIGKEIQLYQDELVIKRREEGQETHVPLSMIERLILTPGDPTPSKLVLLADLDDHTTTVLAEGMSNARDFRRMLPHIRELAPHIQYDPTDMEEQLRQALNNRRMWSITCYGAIILLCILLYLLYLIVAYIGAHHIR